jgi:hypothetical protein
MNAMKQKRATKQAKMASHSGPLDEDAVEDSIVGYGGSSEAAGGGGIAPWKLRWKKSEDY